MERPRITFAARESSSQVGLLMGFLLSGFPDGWERDAARGRGCVSTAVAARSRA
jgi:hypothetical protein